MAKFNHRNAILRICVDEHDGSRLSGQVYSQRLIRPMSFSDLGNLIVQIEKILNAQNFPQAFQRIRSFGGPEVWPEEVAASPDEGLLPEDVKNARGGVTTFAVNVLTRLNASWQGDVDWLDGQPPEKFTSALELVRLIDGRILS